jgi:alkylation response protein AidB-like acyl-CoA dehydrogenase
VDFTPTARQEKVRALARRLAREVVAPAARRADEERRFDRGVVAALFREGLLGGFLPRRYGGADGDDVSFVLACEELGRADASVRGFACVHVGLVGRTIMDHGTAEQKGRWLPGLAAGDPIGAYALTEEGAGSDAAAIATTARETKGGWVLDGEKVWITNGGVAGLVIVYATVDPALKHRGITAFVLEGTVKGLSRKRMPGVELGHRGADHARLVLRGVKVPKGNVLGPVGGGFKVAMQALDHGRLGVAAGAVGIHAALLDLVAEFARTRRQFGKRIGDFQMVQERIADMAAELEASRLLVLRTAWERSRGIRNPAGVAAAKLFATEAAQRAATEAVLLLGSRGYSNGSPVERHYRDVQGLRIYEGTSLVQRIVLAREILGKEGKAP